jgi:outer membrane protein assembly factor BamB
VATALFLLVICFTNSVVAQELLGSNIEFSPDVTINEIDGEDQTHLTRMESLISDGQVDEAIDALTRMMEDHAEKLIQIPDPLSENVETYLPLRIALQGRLARLAEDNPAALAEYRRRVDALAKRWFEEGVQNHDAEKLQRVAEQFFASSWGDNACYLLGEWAIERGHFTAARRYLQRLHPSLQSYATASDAETVNVRGRTNWILLRNQLATAVDAAAKQEFIAATAEQQALAKVGALSLVHPDTDIPLADIAARLVLISILEKNLVRAETELSLFKHRWPEARGLMGGREAVYAETLVRLLADAASWPDQASPKSGNWLTFAGSASRDTVAANGVDVGGSTVWQVELPLSKATNELIGGGRTRVAEGFKLLNVHPVVHDGIVYFSDLGSVTAIDLKTGKPAWGSGKIYDLRVPADQLNPQRRGYFGVPRQTLSVAGNKLFARIGSPATAAHANDRLSIEHVGRIVGLDLAAQGRLLPGFPLLPPEDWSFEGTPLVSDGRLYVGLRGRDDSQSHAAVGCYSLAGGVGQSGNKLLWLTRVSVAQTLAAGNYQENTHQLVTLAEDTVYYQTSLGAVTAIDKGTGKLRWLAKYKRVEYIGDDGRKDAHYFRDLTPALVHQGVVIAAPADSDRLFAIDATTGVCLWITAEDVRAGVTQLLGVGGGIRQSNLIASGDYLYWLDLFDGRKKAQFPADGITNNGRAGADPYGKGRGVLAGDEVYWPDAFEKIHVFKQAVLATKRGFELQPVRTIRLYEHGATSGNLLISGKTLLIAAEEKLYALDGEVTGSRN